MVVKKKITRRKQKKTVKRGNFPKKKVKPLKSSKKQIKRSLKKAKKKIVKNVSKRTLTALDKVLIEFKQGKDTKSIYTKGGKYTASRTKLHNKIIRKFMMMDTSRTAPDLYIFGGVAASGKTSALQKRVNERAMIINNDSIKKELAKATPSPIKKFGLLHAAKLHRESGDIEDRLVAKAMKSKKDVILDRTLANYNKNLKTVKQFIGKGYKVTTLGTNLPPHIAILRATNRFIKKGRFVPLQVIASKGNQTNKNVLRMAKQPFNKRSLVVNTTTRKNKVMFKKN